MSRNYIQLTESIKGRINPDKVPFGYSYRSDISTVSYSDVLVYIRTAMKGVEPEYTQKSKDAGEAVKRHLSGVLRNVTYRYQGSVMTNTHIRGHSDIDLLTISDKFYQYGYAEINDILNTPERRNGFKDTSIKKLEQEVSNSSYSGNTLEDLRTIRLDCENTLSGQYSICDTGKPKAIKITNKNLNREVDVVVANWYDDAMSIINDKGDFRGIQVYNKVEHVQGPQNYPFLSINRINERGALTNGRLKKMIRFLKNLKASSDTDIELSSFDITAICYDIDVKKYQNQTFYQLVPILYHQIKSICTDKNHSDNVISVDGREYIFRYHPEKLTELKVLLVELERVFLDLVNNVKL
ncbi:nucleotidyltransferase domain-containing protein [Pontibacter sp. MBLB2868]|uniref:nucleotidyltransferase domain-containing protein n=1 Tax=Pontibacter sp. MBLB2868 TaxID=3451555 RepID=UPI003F7534C4